MTCADHPCTCEKPEGAEVVLTGLPNVQMLACKLCGVLLWDIEAHYAHAHPADVEVGSRQGGPDAGIATRPGSA